MELLWSVVTTCFLSGIVTLVGGSVGFVIMPVTVVVFDVVVVVVAVVDTRNIPLKFGRNQVINR